MNDALKFRERMYEYRDIGMFEDEELLSMLLSYADTKNSRDVAGSLIDTFGSLKNVFEAMPSQLTQVKGIGKKAATLISMVIPLVKKWEEINMVHQTRIGNFIDASRYCKSLLAGCRTEQFYVICLNANCNVIGKRKISEGSLSEVAAYPRSVVETALNYNAHSVLLSHNHPGGIKSPSAADISSTLKLQKILAGLGIMVLDHVIVAGSETYSMIAHGDIDYSVNRSE